MPDWSTLAIDASCVSGIVNCREYWMNACTSPSVIAPTTPAARRPRRWHEVEVAEEHHRRLDDAGDELGAEAGLVELVVGVRGSGLDLALAAERLDDGVAGERLLDLGVELAGVAPLAMNRDLRALGDRLHHGSTEIGTVTRATSGSSGEIMNIITTSTPTSVSADVSIWLSVCCRLWATLSMSLVTRLSRSPRCWRST